MPTRRHRGWRTAPLLVTGIGGLVLTLVCLRLRTAIALNNPTRRFPMIQDQPARGSLHNVSERQGNEEVWREHDKREGRVI